VGEDAAGCVTSPGAFSPAIVAFPFTEHKPGWLIDKKKKPEIVRELSKKKNATGSFQRPENLIRQPINPGRKNPCEKGMRFGKK
jgi:hypothetical protein